MDNEYNPSLKTDAQKKLDDLKNILNIIALSMDKKHTAVDKFLEKSLSSQVGRPLTGKFEAVKKDMLNNSRALIFDALRLTSDNIVLLSQIITIRDILDRLPCLPENDALRNNFKKLLWMNQPITKCSTIK